MSSPRTVLISGLAILIVAGAIGGWIWVLKSQVSGLRSNVSVLTADLQRTKDELSESRAVRARLDGIIVGQTAALNSINRNYNELADRIDDIRPSDARSDDERKAIECLDLDVPVDRLRKNPSSGNPRL